MKTILACFPYCLPGWNLLRHLCQCEYHFPLLLPPSLFAHGAVVKMSYLAVGGSVSRGAFGVILLWQWMDKCRRVTVTRQVFQQIDIFPEQTKPKPATSSVTAAYSFNPYYCAPNQALCTHSYSMPYYQCTLLSIKNNMKKTYTNTVLYCISALLWVLWYNLKHSIDLSQ